jgi:ribosomal protein S18 acetylase RimI-like enzyme
MARQGGFGSVALNVFGANTVAQTLYRSLGFAVTSIGMHKDLARDEGCGSMDASTAAESSGSRRCDQAQ